jgi:dTDP-4-amino-4,6-dideoxygalactose transaminase
VEASVTVVGSPQELLGRARRVGISKLETDLMIQVTKTFLPDLEEYVQHLRTIWSSGRISNHGPLVERLESELQTLLGVKHLLLTTNGTVALQIAIKALELRDEVVTTPFSYVATTSSLVWEGCRPVFADIEPDTLCLDPERAAEACTPNTAGILATHVYGNACDVTALSELARRRGLRLLFDAAHAFGAMFDGKSLASSGDIAVLSFHATKLFHTGEGGALVTEDDDLAHRIRYMRNFGHRGQEEFWGLGINGKMSELHAAMGLAVLPHMSLILETRRRLTEAYDDALAGAEIQRVSWRAGLSRNCAYNPILLPSENVLSRPWRG